MTAPVPTFSVAKSILGIARELQLLTGVTAINNPLTTINSKRNVAASVTPNAGTVPTVAYFGIGINGFTNVNDSNLAQTNQAQQTDMDLYLPLPFRVVPVSQDLDSVTRGQYRMRTPLVLSSGTYWAYWLKVITFSDNVVQLTQTDPTTGVETPYTINLANMSPTPPTTPINGINSSSTAEVNVTVPTSMPLTGAEVTEAVSAIYGDLRYAKISELGIYTGQDQSFVGTDGNGNPLTYTEAIFAQLADHYCWQGTDMSNPTASLDFAIQFGNGSLLLD